MIVDTEGEGTGEDAKFTFTGVPKPESVPEEATVAAVAASEPATGPTNPVAARRPAKGRVRLRRSASSV